MEMREKKWTLNLNTGKFENECDMCCMNCSRHLACDDDCLIVFTSYACFACKHDDELE